MEEMILRLMKALNLPMQDEATEEIIMQAEDAFALHDIETLDAALDLLGV